MRCFATCVDIRPVSQILHFFSSICPPCKYSNPRHLGSFVRSRKSYVSCLPAPGDSLQYSATSQSTHEVAATVLLLLQTTRTDVSQTRAVYRSRFKLPSRRSSQSRSRGVGCNDDTTNRVHNTVRTEIRTRNLLLRVPAMKNEILQEKKGRLNHCGSATLLVSLFYLFQYHPMTKLHGCLSRLAPAISDHGLSSSPYGHQRAIQADPAAGLVVA